MDVQLHGASFDQAKLPGTALVGVCPWRADARGASWQDTRVELPKPDEIHKCDWTAPAFAAFTQLISQEVPEDAYKRTARESVEQRLDPTKALEGEDEIAKTWVARERETPLPEVYEKSLAGIWRDVGCASEAAPYVLHGLVAQLTMPDNSLFREQSDAAKALAADSSTRRIAQVPMGSPRPTRRSSKGSPRRPQRLRQNRDAKFRRNQIALLPLRW